MCSQIITFLKNVKHAFPSRSFWSTKDYFRLFYLNMMKKYAQGKRLHDIHEEIHAMILGYVDKNLGQYRLQQHPYCKGVNKDVDDQTIWVCWFQGEETMPPVVKVCYEHLKKNCNGHKIVLITLENLSGYLDISPRILDKVGKTLPFTPFSDYIRLNLLGIYGGLWIDSTFLVTKPLDENIFKADFFSIKNDNADNSIVCRYKWAVNFVYCKRNYAPIQHVRNLFSAFWTNSEKSINYLLVDYCFEYERLNNNSFDKALEDMPFSNEDSHEIRLHFNDVFDNTLLEKWMSRTSLFKLTYKGTLNENMGKGEETFYGHVLKM